MSIPPRPVRRDGEGGHGARRKSKDYIMRKVTAGLFHSVDGAVEAPDQWQFDAFDDELGAILGQVIGATDAVILGRVGYEAWSKDFGEGGDEFFGPFINTVPKFVASRTLKAPLGWQNSTLIAGDVAAFVRDLKQQPGGEIAVMGGIQIVRSLFLAGLMDELSLITHPVVAGAGYRRLFDARDTVRLELIRSVTTSKGNVVSTYTLRT
ncbi:MAG: dihydrofolate reductase family protein [Candidatus Methylacidiphilales bacterium]|nr:dihydrofolate reductase family protein [Candidatus Methylacidiphilales bacterium]